MKKLLLLGAALLFALPVGAGIAMAAPGGNSNDTSGDTGSACPDASHDPGGDPACGTTDHADDGHGQDDGKPCNADGEHSQADVKNPRCGAEPPADEVCDDGVDNDGDGQIDAADSDCQGTEGPAGDPTCEDGVDNDGDGQIDAADSDCQETGGAQNLCTAAAGDPGLLTDDTLGQTLYDGGLSALSPLVEDPEANGPLSGAIYDGGAGTPAEPLTDELGCAVDLLIDEGLGGDL